MPAIDSDEPRMKEQVPRFAAVFQRPSLKTAASEAERPSRRYGSNRQAVANFA